MPVSANPATLFANHRLFKIVACLLLLLPLLCHADPDLDELFPSVIQEVFPLKNYGIQEPYNFGQLPDGRIIVITDSGALFAFDGTDWNRLPKKLPKGSSKTFVDSQGTLWVGGTGFFGKVDETFNFIDTSKQLFEEHIDSALSTLLFFETGDWLHFATQKTLFHYNRKTSETKVTKFKGMFDAYFWSHKGRLCLATGNAIQIWANDHFEKWFDWPFEEKPFLSWEHEGKLYVLNDQQVFTLSEDGNSFKKLLPDGELDLRGPSHTTTPNSIILFSRSGILKMHRDGSYDGFYHAWYHQKIDLSSAFSPTNFEGEDIWFLTNTAIFRANFNSFQKEIGIESGYPISGAWDIETFREGLYISSIQGFEGWNAESGILKQPDETSPGFLTAHFFKAFDKLIISTWVELGFFDEQYQIALSDGFYNIFAPSEQKDTFWVVKDSAVRKLNSGFAVLVDLPISEDITSIAEFENELWITTKDGRILKHADPQKPQFTDITDLIPFAGDSPHDEICLYRLEARLFALTPSALFEWKGQAFEKSSLTLEPGWIWELPDYTNQDNRILLSQRHIEHHGSKIGELTLKTENHSLNWEPSHVYLQTLPDSVRRLKMLEGIEGSIAAIISPSVIELINLEIRQPCPSRPQPPTVVKTLKDVGSVGPTESDGIYRAVRDIPLTVQLFSPYDSIENPLHYYGRLKGSDTWISNKNGTFEYYGILRGKQIFEGYVVDAFGNRSDTISHRIRVVPPWFLSDLALALYVLLLILLIVAAVRFQTYRLRQRANELQRQVNEQTKDLQQANQAKSIFVSNVSHEIRNPLNGLLGLAQTLKVGDVIDLSTLQRLRRPSLYLYRFLTNVLDFSKFESGGIRFTDQVFDPNELLESVETMFSGDFRDRNLTFIADYRHDGRAFIVSSQEAIEMILVNLVGNAVKYTPEGGCIRLAILKSGHTLKFSVADTGIGISPSDLEHVFKPYQQGKRPPLISGEKGAGIGLSLVQHTLDQLGGKIQLQSMEGKGSTFTATLPVKEPSEQRTSRVIDKVELRGRYLIVEDLEYNLKLFSDIFVNWGAQADGALNGTTAVNLAKNHVYDMIFVDYDLPDLNGPEVTVIIRSDSKNQTTPVIGLSAYTDQEFIQKGLKSGMNDYLFKPLNPTKLVECLEHYLPEHIHYSTQASYSHANHRSSLVRVLQSGEKGLGISEETTVQAYTATLDQLIHSLKLCDLGSSEFESIVHQLIGHSSFINHQPSLDYWKHLSALSKNGNRMELLEKMESLSEISRLIAQELAALQELERDFTAFES